MTILQPKKPNSVLTIVLFTLIFLSVIAAAWLVVLYAQLVDLNHGIAALRADFQRAQTENAELKEKTFALLGDERVAALVAQAELVKERTPEYLPVDQKWFLALP